MPDNPYDLPTPAYVEADLSGAVIELLRGRCRTLDELVDALYADGWDLDDDPTATVREVLQDDDQPFLPFVDDYWAYLPGLIEGHIFTHRLTEIELEHDVLNADLDFGGVSYLTEFPDLATLSTGAAIEFTYQSWSHRLSREVPKPAISEFGSLVLPPGTLAPLGVAAGELVGLRYSTGTFEVLAVPQATGDADPVRQHVLDLLAGHDPVDETDLILAVLADVPGAFIEPLPPIGELLDSWPIERDSDQVAEQGFDWDEWRTEQRLGPIRQRWELSQDEAHAVATVLTYVRSVSYDALVLRARIDDTGVAPEDLTEEQLAALQDEVTNSVSPPMPGPEELAVTFEFMDDPYLARAILEESWGSDRSGAGLTSAAETLLTQAPRQPRGALHWLRARGLERQGDIAGHEADLRTAERLDPDFWPALVDLARLAGDRGDATTALALLSRVPDEIGAYLRSVLADVAPAPVRTVPRNSPCWCGSGRKFKACHLRQPGIRPLAERTGWLYQKAVVFALECGWLDQLEALRGVRTAYVESDELATEAADDGLAIDVTLFEDGAFDAFVQTRGGLLPADELLLAQQWLLAERSVYEVTEINDQTITFRDLRTGDVLHAVDRLASRDLTPGMFVCTHLLPLPDGSHAIYSIDPVSLPQRTELMGLLDADDPDPVLLVAYLSRHLAPPTMVNTEGHQLAICEVTLETPDPVVLSAALDEAYGAAETGTAGQTWIDHVLVDGEEKIRGMFALVGDELTLNTNSVERRDLMLAALRSLAPDLTETSRLVTPAAELRAQAAALSQDQADVGPFGQPLEDAPEIQAFMAEHMRGYEEKWLDLDIPALNGLTPRQAAADPTRRDDLLRLLATFPETDDPTQMSPQRLRSALGVVTVLHNVR